MKAIRVPLALLLQLSLVACNLGTEVGNGVRPTPPQTETVQSSGSAGAPSTDGASTNDSAETASKKVETQLAPHLYLFAACASPFAETITGDFNLSSGKLAFSITMQSASTNKQVLLTASQTLIDIEVPVNAVGSFQIKPNVLSPSLSCGTVTSETLADNQLKRSVQLSDGTLLSWTLKSGAVDKIEVNANSVVTTYLKSSVNP